MKSGLILIFSLCLMSTQILASGCSEMAAFNTKVTNFLETANLTNETKNKINLLSTECQIGHDMGMEVENIDSCKTVMNMVEVN